jgi:hypothetical protein
MKYTIAIVDILWLPVCQELLTLMPALTPRPRGSCPDPIVHNPASEVSPRPHCSHPSPGIPNPAPGFKPHPILKGKMKRMGMSAFHWLECFTLVHSLHTHALLLFGTFFENIRPGNNHSLDSKRDTLGFLFVALNTLLMLST